jgi:hypothetical protein
MGYFPSATTEVSPECDLTDYANYSQAQDQSVNENLSSLSDVNVNHNQSETVSPSVGSGDNLSAPSTDASNSASSRPKVRKSQRVPKTCISCARKKIKCNKVIPCKPCIERGEAHLCAREVVLVKGLIHNMDNANEANIPPNFLSKMRRLESENSELLKQVSSLQQLVVKLRLENKANNVKPNQKSTDFSSSAESPESASAMSPFSPTDSSVNNYANALQYLTIGIIEEVDGEIKDGEPPSRLRKMNRQSYDQNMIPVFSRKPLDKKDALPSCPSCSIGEMSHCFAARLPFANSSDQKILLSLAFDLPEITRSQSSMIVQYSLECLNFLHNAVHPPSFYLEHEYFWDSNQPKKLSHEFDRVRGQYLWASIWYAILCLGMFYADDNLKQNLKMDDRAFRVLPHMLFAASLECLHRGELYKYPDIRSVQVFCILGPCFQALSGVNMRNSLLNTMVYIAQRLNLDKIDTEDNLGLISRSDFGDLDSSTRFLDRELGRRIWWSVIDFDWMDNTGRESIIKPFSFTTILPGNYNDDDLMEYIDENYNQSLVQTPTPYSPNVCTVSTYHIYMSQLAIIKRKYYFDIDPQRLHLENLIAANEQLDKLAGSLPALLKNNTQKFIYGDHNSQALSLQRYLIHIATDFERLTINRTMAVCVPKAEWNKSSRQICIDSAKRLLINCSLNVPLIFKKHPSVIGNGIAAAVYLLLDMMDSDVTNKRQFNNNLQLIEKLITVLELLQKVDPQARRGIGIIRKLITGALIKAEEDEKIKHSNLKKKRQHDQQQSESAPSLYDIIQRLTILPKVSTAPPKSTGTPDINNAGAHGGSNRSFHSNSNDCETKIKQENEGESSWKSSASSSGSVSQNSLAEKMRQPHQRVQVPVTREDANAQIGPASASPFSIEDFPSGVKTSNTLSSSIHQQKVKKKITPKIKQKQQAHHQQDHCHCHSQQQQQPPHLPQSQPHQHQSSFQQQLPEMYYSHWPHQQQVLYSNQANYSYDMETSPMQATYSESSSYQTPVSYQDPLPEQQQQQQQHQIQGQQTPLSFPTMNASEVTYEDLEIMCGLNNQDWGTSISNFNADFDFDMSLLQQPPQDCPDDS